MTKLAEYAKQHQRGALTCLLCTLTPKTLKEIHEGWKNGVRAAAVVGWLLEAHGVEVTQAQVRNHIQHWERNHATNTQVRQRTDSGDDAIA